MKIFARISGLGLLLALGQPLFLSAQKTDSCSDALHLRDGSRFLGQFTEITAGDTVVFQLRNGNILTVPHGKVRRIVQRCKDNSPPARLTKPYTFKTRGWYHHTRMALLPGQSFYGLNRLGVQLQHSSGFMFNRLTGAGIGSGIEFFDPNGNDAINYPLFAEIRGYLLAKQITPYYSVAGGWALAGRSTNVDNWNTNNWKGGWMAQADLGYRIGNHLTVHFGVRLQRKVREWTSIWGPDNGQGTDRILHKRFVIGLGLLL